MRYIKLNEVSATDRALSLGILSIFISLGKIIGATSIGVVVSPFGKVYGYKNTFLFLVVLLMVILIVAFRLKKNKKMFFYRKIKISFEKFV